MATKTGLSGGEGHKLYEQWRILNINSSEAREIAEKSKHYYQSVRESSK
ncbi:hypothetical protein [Neisseria sp. Ec49-e6-T10]